MLSTQDAIKILNKNKKKYTVEESSKILELLYQFGEIAHSQFKQIQTDEKSNIICKGIYRQAS